MLGVVVGLTAEARLATGLGGVVETGGGDAAGAEAAAARLIAKGVDALLSFGLAGGLDPDLPAGSIILPLAIIDGAGQNWSTDPVLGRMFGEPSGTLLAVGDVLVTIAAKQMAWQQSRALAADLESGSVARVAAKHNLPFAVLRAICDPAGRTLPPAALKALDQNGRIRFAALLHSVARHPGQIPALIALGREASRARSALLTRVRAAGSFG